MARTHKTSEDLKEKSRLTAVLAELDVKLVVRESSRDAYPNGSIMNYGEICDHDTGFLCRHRLKWIKDFLRLNLKK